jgi:hypothetical protein
VLSCCIAETYREPSHEQSGWRACLAWQCVDVASSRQGCHSVLSKPHRTDSSLLSTHSIPLPQDCSITAKHRLMGDERYDEQPAPGILSLLKKTELLTCLPCTAPHCGSSTAWFHCCPSCSLTGCPGKSFQSPECFQVTIWLGL